MNKPKCRVCVYKSTCTLKDDKSYADCQFKPEEEYKEYFDSFGNFNPKSELCIPTRMVDADGCKVCPYCGEKMFTYDRYEDYTLYLNSRCICDGALAEIEYKKELQAITNSYNKKCKALAEKYKDRLKFKGIEKAIDCKLMSEKETLLIEYSDLNEFVFIENDEHIKLK